MSPLDDVEINPRNLECGRPLAFDFQTKTCDNVDRAAIAPVGVIIGLCALSALVLSAAAYTLGVVVTKENTMPVPFQQAPPPVPESPKEIKVIVNVQDQNGNPVVGQSANVVDGTAVVAVNQGAAGGPQQTRRSVKEATDAVDGYASDEAGDRDAKAGSGSGGEESSGLALIEEVVPPTVPPTVPMWKKVAGFGAVALAGNIGYQVYQQRAALAAGFDGREFTVSCKYDMYGRWHKVWMDKHGEIVASHVDPYCEQTATVTEVWTTTATFTSDNSPWVTSR